MSERHIKSMTTEGPFADDFGMPYVVVTVKFRWWYMPIFWLNRLRSKASPRWR